MKAHEMEMADYMRRRGDGVIWCTIRLRHQEADVWICMGQEQGVSATFQNFKWPLDSGTPSSIRIRFCGSNSVPAVTGMP